jgi:hypothetical protein
LRANIYCVLVYKRTSRNGSPAPQLTGCAKTSNDGISFFKFPSDSVIRQQWTKEVQRTRDCWSGPSQHTVLCSCHFTADCFEPDSAIAATMGITKQQRLKPDAVPTLFVRQAPQQLGARGSTGVGSRVSRKRLATTTAPETTQISGTVQVKRLREAYAKRDRSKVRNTFCIYTRQLLTSVGCVSDSAGNTFSLSFSMYA